MPVLIPPMVDILQLRIEYQAKLLELLHLSNGAVKRYVGLNIFTEMQYDLLIAEHVEHKFSNPVTVLALEILTFILMKLMNFRIIQESWITWPSSGIMPHVEYSWLSSSRKRSTTGCGIPGTRTVLWHSSTSSPCTWGTQAVFTDSLTSRWNNTGGAPSDFARRWFLTSSFFSHSIARLPRSTATLLSSASPALPSLGLPMAFKRNPILSKRLHKTAKWIRHRTECVCVRCLLSMNLFVCWWHSRAGLAPQSSWSCMRHDAAPSVAVGEKKAWSNSRGTLITPRYVCCGGGWLSTFLTWLMFQAYMLDVFFLNSTLKL